ncbi:MAG TPA: hypothetical protein VGO93_30495 [Candidatus Xenobia bacterium]|jgi:hypothetical protein
MNFSTAWRLSNCQRCLSEIYRSLAVRNRKNAACWQLFHLLAAEREEHAVLLEECEWCLAEDSFDGELATDIAGFQQLLMFLRRFISLPSSGMTEARYEEWSLELAMSLESSHFHRRVIQVLSKVEDPNLTVKIVAVYEKQAERIANFEHLHTTLWGLPGFSLQ